MRKTVGTVLAVAVVLVCAGCGQSTPHVSRAFCTAAAAYDKELVREQRKGVKDTARQIVFVEALAATAPKAIIDDAQTFLDALRRVETDPSIRDRPRIQRAVTNVNRYANQGCGVYNRSGGI